MAMADLEDEIKRTLTEVDFLKAQLQTLISSLVANKEIFEVDLVPIQTSRQESTTNVKAARLPTKLSLRGKSKFRGDTQSQSGLRPSASQIQKPPPLFEPTLELIQDETFLIPVLDRWIWGTTVVNNSNSPTPLPVLHLTIPTELKQKPSSTFVFTYNYVVNLADMEVLNGTQAALDIPLQKSQQHDTSKNRKWIKPGCKALITASFTDPMLMYNSKGVLRILAALSLDGRHQLSRIIDIKREHAFTLFKDATYKRFSYQIFSILSQGCQESFKLERLRREFSPLPGLKSLLTAVGFEVVSTVNIGNETTVEHLAHDVPSLLFGMLVRLESNSRENPIRCAVGARSSSQMESFVHIFSKWFTRESRSEKNGLKVSSLSPTTPEDLAKALSKGIEVLTHLVLFTHNNCLDTDTTTRNWLSVFQQVMENTDRLFMQKMRT